MLYYFIISLSKLLLNLKGTSCIFSTVAFSPDGTKISGGRSDGLVEVWDS